MATLEKKTLTGLFGEKAGSKLYNWLTPCCALVFRVEAKCVDGQICIYTYGTSPITQTTFIQGNVDLGSFRTRLNDYYSFEAGKEILLDTTCASKSNPPEGTYKGFIINVVTGEPVIAYLVSVDVPFCDA